MRYLHLFFLFVFFSTLQSQTLYWVGGSGNFNDANHWSLSSGGPSSNSTPNNNTDVVFDDNSGIEFFNINFTGNSNIKSLRASNFNNQIIFLSPKSSVISV